MKNLADEFGLNFHTDSPRFFEIIMPFAPFKYAGDSVNNIDGILNGYSVQIYDVPIANSLLSLNYGTFQHTFIDISDKDYNPVHKSSKLPLTLKPVYSLRKILKKVSKLPK